MLSASHSVCFALFIHQCRALDLGHYKMCGFEGKVRNGSNPCTVNSEWIVRLVCFKRPNLHVCHRSRITLRIKTSMWAFFIFISHYISIPTAWGNWWGPHLQINSAVALRRVTASTEATSIMACCSVKFPLAIETKTNHHLVITSDVSIWVQLVWAQRSH